MTTYVERARTRVVREQDEVGTKRKSYDRFCSRIESVSPRTTAYGSGETLISATEDGTVARPIRKAFAETVAPVYGDRPIAELLAAELGEDVATALISNGASLALHRAVRSETDRRQVELAAMDGALASEFSSLEYAAGITDRIREWLVDENETRLFACGFDELRERHERLVEFRESCTALVVDRQNHLVRTTGADGRAGVRHRDLIEHLYEGFPIDHPVLVTATCLDDLCAECQRVVRDHLVRRV